MSEPGYSVVRNAIQAVSSNSPGTTYANTSAVAPVVLTFAGVNSPAVSNQLVHAFIADATNTTELDLLYAMSASNSGTVKITIAVVELASGDDPTDGTKLTTTTFTITPGTGTTLKELNSSTSGAGALSLSFTRGRWYQITISRDIADPGTHTGDMNILGFRWSPVV